MTGSGTFRLSSDKVRIGGAGAAQPGVIVLSESLFAQGFSRYEINGNAGLEIADGAMVRPVMPVYRPRSVNPDAGASSVADALELWTPPVFQEDPLAGRMSQRLGASVSLSAFAPYQPKSEGGLRIGAGALVEVDPGQVIQLQSRGMLRISGTLRAPGGRIEAARGADPVVGIQLQKGGLSNSIWLDGQARLDVAGISAIGIDTAGRQYGLQRDGGRIALDGELS